MLAFYFIRPASAAIHTSHTHTHMGGSGELSRVELRGERSPSQTTNDDNLQFDFFIYLPTCLSLLLFGEL